MKGFFDVHCHLLPGIDDGAKNMEETLAMLEVAYEEGIRHMFTTPHFHPRRGEADACAIENVFGKVQALAEERFPELKLYKGNEIYYQQDTKDMLKSGKVLTLAGSDYVLVEFSFSTDKKQVKQAVGQLMMAGYLPVIAHVERYDGLLGEYDFIQSLVDAGAYIQINSDSVTGEMGMVRKRFVKKLIKSDCVHFIGTDAHDSVGRAPCIEKCAAYLKKKFDEDTMNMLLYYNPWMIVKNKII